MGHTVIGLDDLSGGFVDNNPIGMMFYQGSITDTILVNRLFEQYQFDYVFHLAAYAAEGLSHFIRRYNYNDNLIGSINLINAAVNAGTVKNFIFTSSIAVYGSNEPPLREHSLSGLTKLEAGPHHICWWYRNFAPEIPYEQPR